MHVLPSSTSCLPDLKPQASSFPSGALRSVTGPNRASCASAKAGPGNFCFCALCCSLSRRVASSGGKRQRSLAWALGVDGSAHRPPAQFPRVKFCHQYPAAWQQILASSHLLLIFVMAPGPWLCTVQCAIPLYSCKLICYLLKILYFPAQPFEFLHTEYRIQNIIIRSIAELEQLKLLHGPELFMSYTQ